MFSKKIHFVRKKESYLQQHYIYLPLEHIVIINFLIFRKRSSNTKNLRTYQKEKTH